jgi:pentatricopeptide repeat protein
LLPQAAFGLLDELRRAGLAPSAVTYGCLLAACERSGQVDRAFRLYQRACDEVGAPCQLAVVSDF